MIKKSTGGFVVVGAGSIGQRHIRNLRALGVRDISIVDPQSDRRREAEKTFGVRGFDSLPSALKTNPAAVLICSPTHLHLAQALTAAKSGTALFIEKPISHSLSGVDRLVSVIKRKRIPCLVGCNFRFHPGLLKVKKILASGKLGTIISVRAQFGSYLPEWRPRDDYRKVYSAHKSMGGGILLDRIHEFDYLRWLFGDIKEVSAWMGHVSKLETDVEDTAEVIARFRNGIAGSIHLDALRWPYDCRLEVVGEKGTIKWIYQKHRVRWILRPHTDWHEEKWARYDGNQMYLDEMKHFLRVVRNSEKPEQNAEQAAEILKAVVAVKDAAKQRRAVTVK